MIRLERLRIDVPGLSIKDIDLSVENGEFFALLGPTGAGKTLVLEAISGLAPVTSGRIVVGNIDVTHIPPERRGMGIVYQDCALFPHLTVLQNITYGQRYHKTSQENLNWFIDRLNLGAIINRSVRNLSGGETQRVALARALVVSPAVLLLDEPLSALDPNFREEIRKLLKKLHQETGNTFLMVTHNFAEALFLADRAAVINQGRIEQIGGVTEVFHRPASPFVAEFMGMKNVFPATFHGRKALLNDLEIELEKSFDKKEGYLAVRPEDVVISTQKPSNNTCSSLEGKVLGLVDTGLYYEVSVQAGHVVFQALLTRSDLVEMKLVEGALVYLSMKPSSVHPL
ncbi:MAG: ABC transporter ATP-binding protein [Syntrophobacteria bacterium]